MAKSKVGTVRELASGRFQARYWRDGRQLPAPETFETKKAAWNWLRNLHTDIDRGAYIDPRAGQILFGSYVENRLKNQVATAKGIQSRMDVFELHLKPTFGNLELSAITPSMVRRWYDRLASTKQPTAAKAYRVMSASMNDAVTDELILKSPCRIKGAGKEKSPERPTCSIAELGALFAHLPEHIRLLAALAAWVSFRREEFLGLYRVDFDLLRVTVTVKRTFVYVNGKRIIGPPKTEAGRRTVAIPDHIVPLIENHLEKFVEPESDAVVFRGVKGEPLSYGTLYKEWKAARMAIGRPDLHLHDLRHSGNTWATLTGASLAELMHRMGHESPAAAIRYQHVLIDRDRGIADALTAMNASARIKAIDSGRHDLGTSAAHSSEEETA